MTLHTFTSFEKFCYYSFIIETSCNNLWNVAVLEDKCLLPFKHNSQSSNLLLVIIFTAYAANSKKLLIYFSLLKFTKRSLNVCLIEARVFYNFFLRN